SLTFNEQLNLQGNTLTKTGTGNMTINNDLNFDGGTLVGVSGAISGSGSINGDLQNLSATVAPGNSPGELTIRGNYEQGSAATLAIEIGATASDSLDVNGAITLAGALDVTLLDGADLAAGDQFDILDFDSLDGTFDEVSLPALAAGLVWDDSALYANGVIAVQVPEPSSILLLGLGSLALVAPRRRSRKPAAGRSICTNRAHRPLTSKPAAIAALTIAMLTLTMSTRVSAALVAHYPFEGSAGEVVTGGAANDGIENGGVSYAAGQFGQAISFDGVDDYVVIPDGGGAEVGAGDYSIAFWLNTADNDASFLKTGTSGGPGNGIRALDSGNFGAFCDDGDGVFQVDDAVDGPYLALADPAAAVDGTWHHYAFVRDATNTQVTLYLDGALPAVGTGCGGQPANPMTFAASDVTSPGEVGHIGTDIGGDQLPTGSGFLEGLMDDLAFYDHVLSQAEVQDIFQNGIPFVPPTATTWNVDSFGDWSDPGNWTFFVPNANTETANFGGAISSTHVVTVDAPITVKGVNFNNANSYFISGSSTVTLQADAGNASVNVQQGAHEFQAAVNLSSNTDIDVASGTQLVFENELTLGGNTLTKTSGGDLQINSALTSPGGTLDVQAGQVSGVGKIGGNLNNNGATVAPGKSAGVLEVTGNYVQSAGGTLAIELGGLSLGDDDEFDVLDVSGNATLLGTLDISLIDSFAPAVNDTFDVLLASLITDDGVALSGASGFSHSIIGNNTLRLTFNGVGIVGGDDFLQIQRTDPSMIAQWEMDYGSPAASAAASAVPEPGCLAMALVGALGVLIIAHRGQRHYAPVCAR
ncbi:PEP-CTERM sorting domain-containing protein, partial [Pirellulales bacterium]|nr:PEP-CTERM sorting domain-containing protein [Pirellulales bacterium]